MIVAVLLAGSGSPASSQRRFPGTLTTHCRVATWGTSRPRRSPPGHPPFVDRATGVTIAGFA
jgi:hypothetical protein